MQSFFQRVSSIIRRNSSKLIEQKIDDEEENSRQRQFHSLAERRRSAPDIQRRALAINRLVQIPSQKRTSAEQITIHVVTDMFSRKQYNSIGKFFK
jgi:hypothetical protein